MMMIAIVTVKVCGVSRREYAPPWFIMNPDQCAVAVVNSPIMIAISIATENGLWDQLFLRLGWLSSFAILGNGSPYAILFYVGMRHLQPISLVRGGLNVPLIFPPKQYSEYCSSTPLPTKTRANTYFLEGERKSKSKSKSKLKLKSNQTAHSQLLQRHNANGNDDGAAWRYWNMNYEFINCHSCRQFWQSKAKLPWYHAMPSWPSMEPKSN